MGCGGSKKDVSNDAHKEKKHSEHKSEKESHSEKHPNQPSKDSSSENKAHPKPAEPKDDTKKPKEEHDKGNKKEAKEEHKKEHKEDDPKKHKEDDKKKPKDDDQKKPKDDDQKKHKEDDPKKHKEDDQKKPKEDDPKKHKEDDPKKHKEDDQKKPKEDDPKKHKEDHPKEHKEDHPKEHKEDHPKEHKEDHPKEAKEDHEKKHKKDKHNDEHKEEHHGDKDHSAVPVPKEVHADPAHPAEAHHKEESKKPDQAGGHSGSLIARGDKLLKKAGPKEQAFYQHLFSEECQDPALVQLREIVPHYYGIEVIDGKNFMVLENLLTGYDNPNLLDCKIGKVTWTRDHTEAKLADQRKKAESTTTGSLGFRITGLVVKDPSGQTVESIMKDEGFSTIKLDNIHEYFNKIVNGNKEQVQTFIHQTERILNWFKSQTSKVFFTASLFYVNGKNGKSQTRFIDLAYVYDAEGQHDESKGYLDVIQGLESVIEIWKRLL